MIGARRLDLFICENGFCYASSPTGTSDTAVQASVQQHGFSEQLAVRVQRDKDKDLKKKQKNTVMVREGNKILCYAFSAARKPRHHQMYGEWRAASRSCSASGGRFFLSDCTLQRFTQTKVAQVWD